jgi:hypothetical protein
VVWSKNGGNSWEYFVHLPYPVLRYTQDELMTFNLTSATVKHAPDGTNDNRTTVGIGETVVLTVSGFSDPDYDQGTDQTVYDSMKPLTPESWTSSDPGVAQIVGTSGNTATVYFNRLSFEDSVSIMATVDDDGAYYEDGYAVSKLIVFHTKKPSSMAALYVDGLESPFDGYTPDANGTHIGTLRLFLLQVLPTSVNFDGLNVRENITYESYLWPDQVHVIESVAGVVGPYPLVAGNFLADTSGISVYTNKSYLHNGITYVGASFTFHAPMEYELQSGNYLEFTSNTHGHLYYASGGAKISINGLWSPVDGPWE